MTEATKGKAVIAGKADTVKLIGVEGSCIVYEIGSGRYQFRIANQSAQGKQ